MNRKFNVKGVIYIIAAMMLVIGGFIFIPKMFLEESKPVDYVMVQKGDIPDKILDIMGKYENEERALAIKIDDKIYVVATRGEDKDHGIEIQGIKMVNQEDKKVMKVDIVHKEKQESHPYVVVETNLTDLPDRIEINSKKAE